MDFILTLHWGWWVGFVLLVIVLLVWLLAKRFYLTLKYKDEDLVEDLLDERFWRGMTAEQLRDALGEPLDIDEEALKTKTKSVWKYEQTGKNRYGLKIRLEDGIVVGWTQK